MIIFCLLLLLREGIALEPFGKYFQKTRQFSIKADKPGFWIVMLNLNRFFSFLLILISECQVPIRIFLIYLFQSRDCFLLTSKNFLVFRVLFAVIRILKYYFCIETFRDRVNFNLVVFLEVVRVFLFNVYNILQSWIFFFEVFDFLS